MKNGFRLNRQNFCFVLWGGGGLWYNEIEWNIPFVRLYMQCIIFCWIPQTATVSTHRLIIQWISFIIIVCNPCYIDTVMWLFILLMRSSVFYSWDGAVGSDWAISSRFTITNSTLICWGVLKTTCYFFLIKNFSGDNNYTSILKNWFYSTLNYRIL